MTDVTDVENKIRRNFMVSVFQMCPCMCLNFEQQEQKTNQYHCHLLGS